MNKKIIPYIVLAAGLVLIVAGLIFSGGKLNSLRLSTDKEGKRVVAQLPDRLDSITINELSSDIKVVIGTEPYASISYYEGDANGKMVENVDGTKAEFTRQKNSSFYISGFDFTDYDTVLTLPADYSGVLYLVTTSGSINSDEKFELADFSASATSGNIKIKNIVSKEDFVTGSTSGDIQLEEVAASGNLAATATSGEISLKTDIKCNDLTVGSTSGSISLAGVKVNGELQAKANSGEITIKDVSVEKDITVGTTSGSILFNNLEGKSNIAFKATSGDVIGIIKGNESDFSIISSTTSGSNNLTNSRSGNQNLDANTTSGSINISFQ